MVSAGVDDVEARRILAELSSSLVSALLKDGEIKIPGIGIVFVAETPARVRRNPKTGTPFMAPPTARLGFRYAMALRREIKRRGQ